MNKLLIFFAFNCLTSFANAQWIQTNLDSANVFTLAISGNNIYAGTDIGVYLSSNDGSSWTLKNNGLTNSYVYALVAKGDTIFAGTLGGVFLSANNGSNWVPVNTGLIYNGNIPEVISLAINENKIFAGSYGSGIFFSPNNGSSWSAVNNGIDIANSGYVPAIAINNNKIFAGTYNGVFWSSNDGNNWTTGATVDTIPAVALAVKEDTIFAGDASCGVYLSTDNGNSWIMTGLLAYDIYSLAIKGNSIFAGTYHNGVFLSTDNGSSWSVWNTGLTDSADIYSFAINGNYIFAAYYGNGVWRRPLSEIADIEEININTSDISVYPNPAINNLTIESLQKSTLDILNIQGQTIQQQTLLQGKTVIDISELAKGLYILRLNSIDNTEVTKFLKE